MKVLHIKFGNIYYKMIVPECNTKDYLNISVKENVRLSVKLSKEFFTCKLDWSLYIVSVARSVIK